MIRRVRILAVLAIVATMGGIRRAGRWLWHLVTFGLVFAFIALAMCCAGCGFMQREKQLNLLTIVSQPKFQPQKSWMATLTGGDLKDITGIGALAGVGTEAVKVAGNADAQISHVMLPADRDNVVTITTTKDGIKVTIATKESK